MWERLSGEVFREHGTLEKSVNSVNLHANSV
jgi:hypothetical protein